MRYKAGDTVTIKSLDEITPTLEYGHDVILGLYFNDSMENMCGRSFEVYDIESFGDGEIIVIRDGRHEWSFVDGWLEPPTKLKLDEGLFDI